MIEIPQTLVEDTTVNTGSAFEAWASIVISVLLLLAVWWRIAWQRRRITATRTWLSTDAGVIDYLNYHLNLLDRQNNFLLRSDSELLGKEMHQAMCDIEATGYSAERDGHLLTDRWRGQLAALDHLGADQYRLRYKFGTVIALLVGVVFFVSYGASHQAKINDEDLQQAAAQAEQDKHDASRYVVDQVADTYGGIQVMEQRGEAFQPVDGEALLDRIIEPPADSAYLRTPVALLTDNETFYENAHIVHRTSDDPDISHTVQFEIPADGTS